MDDKQKDAEQVEDLELQDQEAEDVKGGFSWGVSQTFKPTESLDEGPEERLGQKVSPGIGRMGGQVQHNETLITI